jgi:hypothetical protein
LLEEFSIYAREGGSFATFRVSITLSDTGVPLYGCGFLSFPIVFAVALSPSSTASEMIDPLWGSFFSN